MSLVAREAITPTNKSPIFCIVTWVLEAAVLLAVAVKVGLLRSSVGLHSDDWSILVATILSIGQVIAVSFQGVVGVGRIQESLSHAELLTYQKSGYAAELLYVLTFAASKLAVVFFIFHLTDFGIHRRVAVGVGVFIILWSIASFFVVAFQCRNPYEWALLQGQCIDLVSFWTSYDCLNIATELAVIVLPLVMVFSLNKICLSNKVLLAASFSLRAVVIVGIALQIYHLHHPTNPPESSYTSYSEARNDITFTTWRFVMAGQVSQSLSIITTCISFLKSLLLGMQTGMMQTGHVSSRHLSEAGRKYSNRHGSRSSATWYGSNPGSQSGGRAGSADSGTSNTPIYRAMADYSLTVSQPRNPSVGSTGSNGPHITWRTGPHPSRVEIPREVSMIAEEDEEEKRRSMEPETAHVRGGLQDSHPLDVRIPSGHISLPNVHI